MASVSVSTSSLNRPFSEQEASRASEKKHASVLHLNAQQGVISTKLIRPIILPVYLRGTQLLSTRNHLVDELPVPCGVGSSLVPVTIISHYVTGNEPLTLSARNSGNVSHPEVSRRVFLGQGEWGFCRYCCSHLSPGSCRPNLIAKSHDSSWPVQTTTLDLSLLETSLPQQVDELSNPRERSV